ncbi:uncharacterized protein LOC142348780 [Convolutriloba macropyga]|uniref:uncharacterized protein LOC142348780 n=1 Tax=Convolutriloba macropyga TaxID=536237 RepID=UPI003F51F63D
MKPIPVTFLAIVSILVEAGEAGQEVEFKYTGGGKLAGASLDLARETIENNKKYGLDCNPCEERVEKNNMSGEPECQRVYRLRQEEMRHSDLIQTLQTDLKFICGKMDYSIVRECEFNVGDSLKNCKAGVVFDFHKNDKPNPCDNKKLIKTFGQWQPRGSCVDNHLYVSLTRAPAAGVNTSLIVKQNKFQIRRGKDIYGGGDQCEVDLPAFNEKIKLNKMVTIPVNNRPCEYFFGLQFGREVVQYEIQSLSPREHGFPRIKSLRMRIGGATKVVRPTEGGAKFNHNLKLWEKSFSFSHR